MKDVNESPQFPPEVYSASVFSIAPYKTPVIQVKVNTPNFFSFHLSGNNIMVLRMFASFDFMFT